MNGDDLIREWYDRTAQIAELADAVVASCDPSTKKGAKTVDPLQMAPLRDALRERERLAVRMLKAGVMLPTIRPIEPFIELAAIEKPREPATVPG